MRSDDPDKCLSLAKIGVFGNQYGAEKLVNAAAESIKLHLGNGHERQIPVRLLSVTCGSVQARDQR